MAKRKQYKNPNQLELNFLLSTGAVPTTTATQLEFDFFNIKHNFFAQLYQNKTKLKVDILRLVIAEKISESRKPVKRMLLFKSEKKRKKITHENYSVLKKYGIETATIIVEAKKPDCLGQAC